MRAKSSHVIHLKFEHGPKGLTWAVKANFSKLDFNGWKTSYDTSDAPKIGSYNMKGQFMALRPLLDYMHRLISPLTSVVTDKTKA